MGSWPRAGPSICMLQQVVGVRSAVVRRTIPDLQTNAELAETYIMSHLSGSLPCSKRDLPLPWGYFCFIVSFSLARRLAGGSLTAFLSAPLNISLFRRRPPLQHNQRTLRSKISATPKSPLNTLSEGGSGGERETGRSDGRPAGETNFEKTFVGLPRAK